MFDYMEGNEGEWENDQFPEAFFSDPTTPQPYTVIARPIAVLFSRSVCCSCLAEEFGLETLSL
jgi:hypothetical protein